MVTIGIEKINVYGCSLYMKQEELAMARGRDPEMVVKSYMINSRSLNPPYEDTVTMGANAAKQMLSERDLEDIGMLIVGTEGSVDFGKPISTNIHQALGLHPNVRNYETKFACYSGVAALDCAINWIAAGLNHGKKALIIATDFSRMHLGEDYEFIMGGCAAAILISETPKVVQFELKKKGTWTTDAYDTFRPTATEECGNNEVSLFTYVDVLEGSYQNYLENVAESVNFDTYFKKNIYHMPFPGMAFQAHRTLCNMARPRKKAEVKESFNEKVLASLRYADRVGSTYGASNFIGLCGLIDNSNDLLPGDRIGFFSYGSGAIGEYYSALICKEAKEVIGQLHIDGQLDKRKKVTPEEYEKIEKMRLELTEKKNFVTDLSVLGNWYDQFYRGKGYLYLKEVKEFQRIYEWS